MKKDFIYKINELHAHKEFMKFLCVKKVVNGFELLVRKQMNE